MRITFALAYICFFTGVIFTGVKPLAQDSKRTSAIEELFLYTNKEEVNDLTEIHAEIGNESTSEDLNTDPSGAQNLN